MNKLDYSSFSRFCYCVYRGYTDILSADYQLGKLCCGMSYDEMKAFYIRFKETVKYINDLDSFLYLLKWLNKDPDSDLTREAVLYDVYGNSGILKENCVDELYCRYCTDIDELTNALKQDHEIDANWLDPCFWNDEELPF